MLEIVRTRPTPSTGYTPPTPCLPNNGNLGIGQRCSKCAPCVAPQVTQDFHRATSQLFQRHLIRQNNRSYVLHNLYLVRNGQVFAQRSVDLRLLVHHGLAQIDESPEFLHNSTTIPLRAYHFPMIPSIIQFYFPVCTSVVEGQCGSHLTPIQARAIYVNGDEKNAILSGYTTENAIIALLRS